MKIKIPICYAEISADESMARNVTFKTDEQEEQFVEDFCDLCRKWFDCGDGMIEIDTVKKTCKVLKVNSGVRNLGY